MRRWRSTPGRTVWEFLGGREGGDHFLVPGLGAGRPADLALPRGRDELLVYGPLLSDDGAARLGTAAPVRAPGMEAARALLTRDRCAAVEVYRRRFGGRPS